MDEMKNCVYITFVSLEFCKNEEDTLSIMALALNSYSVDIVE